MSTNTGAKIVERTVYGNSNSFEVKVGMHQGSALSPLLFLIAMEALSREFRVALPWEMLYAHDLVVIAETEDISSRTLLSFKRPLLSVNMSVCPFVCLFVCARSPTSG